MRFDAYGIAQDAVSIVADLDQVSAEFLAGDHEEGDVGEGKEERLRGSSGRRDDGAIGDLVDDLGTLASVRIE